MNRALRTQGAPTMAGMEGGVWIAGGHWFPLGSLRPAGDGAFAKRYLFPPSHGVRRQPNGFAETKTILTFAAFAVSSLLALGVLITTVVHIDPPDHLALFKKTQADLIAYREALATYEVQTGNLPTMEQGLRALWEKPTTGPVPGNWHPIMTEEANDPWNHSYQYRNPGLHNPKSYDVFSMGPDGIAGTADDVGNWPATSGGGM